jgi:hypothetical protein
MNNEPVIIWEKWKDPFGGDEDVDEDPTKYWDEENEEDLEDIKRSKVIVTPMGLIPYSENTNASKIFKFWVGHTNFTISQRIASMLEEIDGIETLDIYTRYRFRIGIGKTFNDREVMSNINKVLYSYIEQKYDSATINS